MSLYLGNKPISSDGSSRLTGEIGDMGFAPLGIDESLNLRRYLNGQVISQIQFVSFTNKVKSAVALSPSLATTEDNWQAEKALSKFGQVGKFVIDDENQTIRLPAVVNAQGLLDLTGIGNLVNESLPNIKNTTGLLIASNDVLKGEALYIGEKTNDTNYSGTGQNNVPLYFDASRSSSTYQDNAPVQQEAIQYPYYIQVATGIEETLPAIREYGINTPFFFGWSQYFENAPYNASLLASQGQYNASNLYPDLWTQLTGVELNGSLNVGDTIEISGKTYVKRGLPVVLSTDTITDYDFVVDLDNSQFRLPLLNGERILVAKKEATTEDPTWYNLYSDGWCEQGGIISGWGTSNAATINLMKEFIDTNYSLSFTVTAGGSIGAGVTAYVYDKTKNSIVVGGTAASTINDCACSWTACGYGNTPIQSDFTEVKGLYYYAGDTIQDASLINAGAVLSDIVALKATKANIDASNFTATGKANIISISSPKGNFNGSTIFPYTAQVDGEYYFFGCIHNSAYTLNINGYAICEIGGYSWSRGTVTLNLKAGDVVSITNSFSDSVRNSINWRAK
jgi:hypothetical protein